MILGHDQQGPTTMDPEPELSPDDVARALRRARHRRGLRLGEVATRTGQPVELLRVVDAADFESCTDRLAVLEAVRRYAEVLGLPGDRFAHALVDRWPMSDPGAAGLSDSGPGIEAVGPSTDGPHDGAALASAITLAAAPAPALEVSSPTSVLARVPAPADGPTFVGPVGQLGPATETVPAALFDTGPLRAVRGPRDPSRPPLLLRTLVVVVAAAIVLGTAGIVLYHVRPSWLHDLGVLKSAVINGTGNSPTTPTTAARAAGGRGSTKTTLPPAVASALTPTPTDASDALVTVPAARFTVRVTAVDGTSWVQATSPSTAAPLFSNTLQAGQTQSFTATTTLIIQVGSVAGRISVTADGRLLLVTYVVPGAPYTVRFQPKG